MISAFNRKKIGWHLKTVLSEPVRTEETYLMVVGEGEGKETRRRRGRGERNVNCLKVRKDWFIVQLAFPEMGEKKSLYSLYLTVGYTEPFGKTDFIHMESTWVDW